MSIVEKPHRSKVVQGVGVFLILIGLWGAEYTFGLLAEVFPLTRSDVLPFALSFVPSLILCVIGIGTMLHKRWALFAWLGLTGLAFFGLLTDLFVSPEARIVPFGVIFVVIRVFATALVVGIPTYLLWKRRNLFTGAAGAADS